MEAVAKAMRRHEQDTSGDDESAGSEAESGKMDRKSSEASILHRMAVADSKTMWKAELETNYEESEHAPPLIEEEKDINAYKIQPYTLAPGLSPVKRALPERKTKHKDLEERRQKGRQQRIRATQAAHEAPTPALSSLQAQSSYKVVIEETEHDVSGEGSRRSSMVTGSSTEKSTPQPRASSAPRSSAIVGNAYALENLPDPEVIMFPSIDSTTEVNEEIAADKSEEIRLELPQAAVPSFQDVKEMQACDNSFLPIIGTITTENEDTECWEEQTDSTTSSDTRREQTEELLSNATTLEERTSDDQKPVNDDVSRVIAPVPDIGVDTPTQGQNFYPKENNSDVQENKSQYAVENASSVAKVQVNEDYQEISDLDGRNSDIVGSDVLSEDNEGENDATHPRSSDTISNADSILPSPRNIGEFSDTSDVGDDKRCTTLANDVYQLELPQEENVACADPDDIKTLASVIHQQHVDKETDFEVGGSIGETTGIPFGVVSASDSELEPLAHDDDPPVTSGPSIIFEPAMHLVGGEERASAILGQDEKLSLEKHDDDEMKHTKAAEFIPSASPGQTPSPSEKTKFVSFCDKDRPNLVFLQFQVFHRLKLYVDAIECMNKVIALHESIPHQPTPVGGPVLTSANALAHFAVYNAADYRLMLMQCQQASGDYVAAAQSLASVLKLKGIQQDTTLRDEQYFDLWYSLAEKCFHHEDYALALEYYAIALNFAKQSQVLAAIHYNLGLCFQSLGEDNKCVTEYKRARTANRHVPPLVSLTELSTPYDERFAQLLQKTVVQTIEEVRVELYGRAVRRLQRVFRQSRRNLNINLDNKTSDIPQAKMPSLSKRRLSIALARNPPALVKIEDAVEESDVHEEDNVLSKAVITDDNQVSKREESALEITERRHESFLVRKQAAVEEMADLLANPQYRGRGTSPSSRPNARVRAGSQLRSGLLSPEKDRLDVRRKQSMETFRQLGYVSSTMPWIEFWEKLLVLALDLFETRQTLYASIARVRGRLPLVADDVAFCALAESIGNVHEAVEKLHDPAYERELTYVCAVIEVSKQLVQHFPLGPGQLPVKSPHVSLPTVSSPRTDTDGSHNSMGATIPGRTVLPPYSPTREASASNSNSKQHLRLNQMLNLHFQEHVQQQEAAIAIAEATGGFAHPQRRMEKLAVLKDFRKANDVLLSSQLAFGSERATT
ncbi:hypothetical protein PR003_g8919 [Phytophthora rubi]|uniref:Uncharacterized protein n=1 Tax=Phytophthora rubi TaxID=129364 RepID=A0A6A4FI61_9STRA|nr:hypothetical protein PR003_g8919 [Phytophthora rubi]